MSADKPKTTSPKKPATTPSEPNESQVKTKSPKKPATTPSKPNESQVKTKSPKKPATTPSEPNESQVTCGNTSVPTFRSELPTFNEKPNELIKDVGKQFTENDSIPRPPGIYLPPNQPLASEPINVACLGLRTRSEMELLYCRKPEEEWEEELSSHTSGHRYRMDLDSLSQDVDDAHKTILSSQTSVSGLFAAASESTPAQHDYPKRDSPQHNPPQHNPLQHDSPQHGPAQPESWITRIMGNLSPW